MLALRLQGFKSFAERTNVEFGGGISAIVGPNGSGKSNLADALRWALGEQGRALRSRKAEDVIWAGSDKRAAQGMADVTLVIDNADGLLPVDFQVLELGRRLYRSGENDYLLNKQRIRLRDLVELLDAAHLADNAFLFIGQGMVDQALALRPEERRPLFEEVAGVRRHERRRRRAQEQLVESEANLARVEDIVAELRPQARRLAAQAEQQTSRQTTADELAAAILLSAHGRWHEAAARVGETQARRASAGADADRAMADMTTAETAASSVAAELGVRAVAERERREAHDTARATLTAAQLGEARVASEIAAIERDRTRIAADRSGAESELAAGRRSGAVPVPPRDIDLEAALAEAERETAAALAELGALRAERQAQGEELAALRRAAAAQQAELETARRRAAEAARQAAGEGDRATAAAARRDATAALATAAHDRRAAALEAERAATAALERARAALEAAEAERSAAEARAVGAEADLAAVQNRTRSLEARLAEEEGRGIAKAARRHGGRRVDEELVIDPGLRAAVEAALGEATRAYLVKSSTVTDLATERGALIVEERASAAAPTADARERRFLDAVSTAGGGLLADAVQRDGNGAARRLLSRAAWVPDLASCLSVQVALPGGWIVVPRDGSAVVGELAVSLGAGKSVLQRRAEATTLGAEVERLAAAASSARTAAGSASAAAGAARTALEAARTAESRAATDRRTADDAERVAARDAEAAVRESVWAEAQADRLRNEHGRAAAALAAMDGTPDPAGSPAAATPTDAATSAIEAWEARAAEMRARRDRLAEQAAAADAARREAEAGRTRAETGIALAEERMARADRELEGLDVRSRDLAAERDRLRSDLATAVVAEAAARGALAELHAADAADRERLSTAEQGASAARERLRAADDRLRTADRAELEARLGLDSLRESILVDLAGLGEPGLAHLAAVSGMALAPSPIASAESEPDTDDEAVADVDVDASGDTAAFESALDGAADRWAAAQPTETPPGPARLGQLRRRFHELGAVNPYAVDEYAELKTRLETLETQATDLRTAIVRTRELIAELETMIADQFQTTFRALEVAFASRFEQLFGGGFARISLTDPSDLGSTGVEIVARPPGKKAQALAMLSGGERALTAVALLFAMLEVRPVPFCVLDEVDAALDEANVGRFAEALRGLAHQTQFIVITHNRGTIEAADALYGVTVGDDSVSRVISLRLDEAKALADQGRGELAPTR